jgi:histidinol-phosphate/aromatic aminotransferase/cobyric acid decarboxylase-like protein/choline kinase
MKAMQALILAAGYGGRMRPLTDDTHKTLIEISGETIISRIVNGLNEVGIIDLIIVLGYRDKELKKYLLEKHLDVRFQFILNERYAETNNIYSLALALESVSIEEDIVLIESDLVFRPEILRKLIDSPFDNVALVDKYRTGMDGTVVKIHDNRITEVIPSHLQSSDFDFSDKYKTLNVYKFKRKFINGNFKKIITYYAKTIDDNCYYELILGLLIYMQQDRVHAEIVEGDNWAEVDDPNDVNNAEYVFNKTSRLGILESGFGGYWNYDVTDFCFIRNMYFPTDSMISEMKGGFSEIIHNYGSKQVVLNRKLSYVLLCDERKLQLLNGASQVYPILQNLYANKKALLPQPTFGEYNRIFSNVEIYQDEVGFTKSEIEDKLNSVGLVVFVNPNNPTGSMLQTDWIYLLAKENPDKAFIVDESFIEFSDQTSIIYLLESQPLSNVIVVTSLSKTWGVPGVRLGYCYTSNSQMMTSIRKATPIWNSNSLAEYFLEIFLKHRGEYSKSLSKSKKDREEFSRNLNELSLVDTVYPSGANFLLVRLVGTGEQASRVVKQLLEEDVYVKDVSSKFSDKTGYLRIAVRSKNDHKKLLILLSSKVVEH